MNFISQGISNIQTRHVLLQTLDDVSPEFIFSINASNFRYIQKLISNDIKKNTVSWRIRCLSYSGPYVPLLFAILNVSRTLVESGRYHSYLGVLNLEGHELVEVFDKACSKLIELKQSTIKEVKEAKKELIEAISNAG